MGDNAPFAASSKGEWREVPLVPSFTAQAGDSVGFDPATQTAYVLRGGVRVAEWALVGPGTPLPPSQFEGPQNLTRVIYFRSRHMAVKTCTGVSVGGSGSVTFKFSDGNQRELTNHAAGVELANDLDSNDALAENILIAKAYRHSPDGTALADVIGSTCTIDTAAENPIQTDLAGAML